MPSKPTPRTLTVASSNHITPNMIRVTLKADFIANFRAGIEGAHCKLFLPEPGQSNEAFKSQLENGPRPSVRTYTIRHVRPDWREIDIDFVDHGDSGPASAWARRATVGSICGFAGPGPVKLSKFYADYYVIAVDMSAIPVAAATLEAMPRDAEGTAVFEITSEEDKQSIDAPEGIEQHWVIHENPHVHSTQAVTKIRSLLPFAGQVQTCIAGESSVVRALREEIVNTRGISKSDAYISGYWKIGLVEDEHQELKRQQSAP
ncbi:MAG: siderophore-interacting protein [Pseudomonadota bacterium]